MRKLFFSQIFAFMTVAILWAQDTNDQLETIRTQSGVDPTRVTSRAGYFLKYYVQEKQQAQINNGVSLTLGVNRWSFAIKPELISNNYTSNGKFVTGLGDVKFSILNAFFVKGKVALAGSIEFGAPLGTMNNGYFSATPALTFSYTITPSLFFAAQPQYTFSLAKIKHSDGMGGYPTLSNLTLRLFIAQFTKSGFFFVIEPRPIYNFTSKEFDFIISPIIGKALGGGYNLVFLSEIPTNYNTQLGKQGVLLQIGINKNF